MATKEVKVCDVTQKSGPTVVSYEITVSELPYGQDRNLTDAPALMRMSIDLSARSLERLLCFIYTGCSPTPKTRKAMEAQQATEAGKQEAPQEAGQPAT